MKSLFKIALSMACLVSAASSCFAQLTNIGDTMSISNGSFIYIPGNMNLVDSTKYPEIINNGTIKIAGDFIKSLHTIYSGGTDSLILTGKDSQSFPGFSYYRFLADSGGNKSPLGNPEIRNTMLLKGKSIVSTGDDTVVIDSAANLYEDDTDYILGNARYSKYMLQNFYYQNGGIGLETVSDSANPDNTIIFRKTGIAAIQNGFCNQGVQIYYQVSPQNPANPGALIQFHYFPHELNGIKKKYLWLYQSPDNGKNWYAVDSIFNDTFNDNITCLPGKPFARYTLGDSTNPLENAVKAGPFRTICQGEKVQIGGAPVGNHVYSWASVTPGFVSSVANPVVSPITTTTYYLKEMVPTTACVNIDSVTVTVNPGPKTGWKITGTCPQYTFQASDSSFDNYIWDFGDGHTGTGYSVSHIFASDSIYAVRLVVSDSTGCTGELDSLAYFNVNNLDLKIFPNPFSSNIQIQFNLCDQTNVLVSVCDVNGKDLGTIVNGVLDAGFHKYAIDFKTHNWSEGMYFIRMYMNGKWTVNKVIRMQ